MKIVATPARCEQQCTAQRRRQGGGGGGCSPKFWTV